MSETGALARRGSRLGLVLVVAACGGDGPVDPESGDEDRGNVALTAATSGSGSDADGYTVTIAGTSRSVSANGSAALTGLPVGTYELSLSGLATHCRVTDVPDDATISAGETVEVFVEIECVGGFAIDEGTTLSHLTSGGELISLTPIFDRIGLWRWAPDGGRIVFEGDDGEQTDLWVVNADGTGLTNVTATEDFNERRPDWSPDSEAIVYWRSPLEFIEGEVWTAKPDGSDAVPVATEGTNDYLPRWSPDGARIVFVSDRTGTFSIWTTAPDGSDPVRLTIEDGSQPEWSPDGTRIGFGSIRDGNQEVYVMASDGSDPINLSNSPDNEVGLGWFPDSETLLFSGSRSGSFHIFSASVDGSDLVQLTSGDDETNQSANVSSDGSLIMFVLRRGAEPGVYVMNPDGSDPWRVHTSGSDARWRPGM